MEASPEEMSPEQIASIKYQQENIDDDRTAELMAVYWTIWTLTAVALFLRFYARRLVHNKFMHEDGWIVAAEVLFTSLVCLNTWSAAAGHVKHLITIDRAEIPALLKTVLAWGLLYSLTIFLVKTSVLIFFYRTFGVNRNFKIAVWCVMGVNTARLITGTVALCLQCIPFEKIWNRTLPGRCLDLRTVILADSIVNVISDAVVVIMPIPMVLKLNLPRARKIALCGIFALGSIVVIASILRMPSLRPLDSFDFTWNNVDIGIWSVIEMGLGIVGACLPLLTPIFRKVVRYSSRKPTHASSERTWPHARIEEGRSETKQKDLFGDDVPLNNVKVWSTRDTSNVTNISHKPRSEESSPPKGEIKQDVDLIIETVRPE